jgi:hypothetical protein
MIKKHITLFLFSVLFCTAQADTLILKNGLTLEGNFKGGTEGTIRFETSGAVQEIAITEVKSITFTPSQTETQTGSQTIAPPAAVVTSEMVPVASGTKIPAGTKLMIKTAEDISTASHQKGAKFKCVLEADLVFKGSIIAPKGSEVYGVVIESIGGRRVGNQIIVVSFNQISLKGQLVAMETDEVGAEGGRGGAARAVGAGALIGAAAGDAAAGAAVGAGIALLAGGKHIQIPAGTIVEVSLKQEIAVP